MKKAITVTADNKKRNPKYLSFTPITGVVVYDTTIDFPGSWGTPNWRKENFSNVSDVFHEEAGFFPVVVPPYDPTTEKLGSIFEDAPNKMFSYPVVALTPTELETIDDAKAGEEENTKSNDGKNEAIFIFKYLRKLKNDGTLTDNQYVSAQNLMFDALLPMTFGMWHLTQSRLVAVPDPANATLLAILNEIRSRINDYINNL